MTFRQFISKIKRISGWRLTKLDSGVMAIRCDLGCPLTAVHNVTPYNESDDVTLEPHQFKEAASRLGIDDIMATRIAWAADGNTFLKSPGDGLRRYRIELMRKELLAATGLNP